MDNSEKLHRIFKRVCKGWDNYMAGKMGVDAYGSDCSCGCKFFLEQAGGIGDWGICLNKESPRG